MIYPNSIILFIIKRNLLLERKLNEENLNGKELYILQISIIYVKLLKLIILYYIYVF